jgi:hypothetical protein
VKATNEIPQITINYPQDNVRIEAILTITGSADDPDGSITDIEVSIDGGSWDQIDVSDLWSYEINTDSFTSGEHVISFRAFDGEDYSEEVVLTVYVGEEKEEMDLLLIFGLLAIVIIAVLVLAYFISKRAKKNPPLQESIPKQPRTFQPLEKEKEAPQTRMDI